MLAGCLTTAAADTPLARPRRIASPYPAKLIFRDLERFRTAHAMTKRGTSALSAMQWYVAGATEGLKAYLRTYEAGAIDLAARFASHPALYAELAGIRERLADYEDDIRHASRNLQRLVPELPDVPMYFFVGALGHGATVKEVTPEGGEHGLGVLIPIELIAVSLDALPQLTTHELAHVAQVQHQGLERYRVIYREQARATHLAYAIREGGADLLSQQASGLLRERHHYLLAHEAALWREFSRLLYEPVGRSPPWFSAKPEQRTGRPGQLGYAIGWSICKCFHEQASDQRVALRAILSANEPQDFERIVAPYAQRYAGV